MHRICGAEEFPSETSHSIDFSESGELFFLDRKEKKQTNPNSQLHVCSRRPFL